MEISNYEVNKGLSPVVIETKNLVKAFNLGNQRIKVLNDINLVINEGEFVSIMGPSGSGKSTLLYLIGGLDLPSSGNVKINGKEMVKMNDRDQSIMRRREIGFVFQFYNLIPNLNVEENVLLPLLLDGKKVKNYQNKLNKILEIVELSNRRKHTPRELSGGQQQRVAIARALMEDPQVILADEPIGNLDSKTGMEIMKLLRQINLEENKTIVQVTHSTEAAEYGRRVIYVKDGRVVE
ncbi:ABC transporter ATP-binding protein [Clostridium oryzae]|uniref:Lipoprotein-releasing system ATP-binding protein LolD n=1 Tax=Clostridium oryzae TaxID=1450648 RepID=A0A1V4IHC6_9CLOT|nr:ABC transporter ATP-binding protein [Clostridium oryzae]OPJ59329.1 lipoprotein-releasing system ATP-binding protein LolD [Clostridium oryzae]